MAIAKCEVFTHEQFYEKFQYDLTNAMARIIIYSPFVSPKRLAKLLPYLEAAVKRGVRVCVYIQKPLKNKNNPTDYVDRMETLKMLLDVFKSIGVHVTLVPRMHEKMAIIDESIFWDGSLNILSHSDSSERMTRWEDREKLLSEIKRHNLTACSMCRATRSVKEIQNIANYLRKRRQSLGLSQKALSEQSKIAQKTISQIESGKKSDFKVSTYERLCKVLQLELRPIPEFMLPSIDEQLDTAMRKE
ncbi:MAG: helix-turn-helix domain-containing protein [Candidatus Obscuribacterales bacterium]|nr:helix-turn-helix domain-containing protein [Candidatus Obscuribacterales bacterium]